MSPELVSYVFNHYSYLAPIEVLEKIKYPYLKDYEKEQEKGRIAVYLVENFSNEIFINNCPVCKRLARTPKAKQCRHCRHDWH